MSDEEKKDIPDVVIPKKKVDSSWKEEIRKEKEAARLKAEQEKAKAKAKPKSKPAAAAGPGAAADAQRPSEIPSTPATQAPIEETEEDELAEDEGGEPNKLFINFIASMIQQALMMLGAMENPMTGQRGIDLEGARHNIDTLQVVREKCEGNLIGQEQTIYDDALRELQMHYVEAANAVAQHLQKQNQPGQGPGGAPDGMAPRG